MSNHTPAPWRLTHCQPYYGKTHEYVIWATMPYQALQSEKGNDSPIGSINMHDSYGHVYQFPTNCAGEMIQDAAFNRSELNAKANAELIRAAPEMYAILDEILTGDGMQADTLGKINQLFNKLNQ